MNPAKINTITKNTKNPTFAPPYHLQITYKNLVFYKIYYKN